MIDSIHKTYGTKNDPWPSVVCYCLSLQVCKESETAASGTGKENPEIQENPTADSSNSSSSDETVKESIKEDGSSSMKLVEEVS